MSRKVVRQEDNVEAGIYYVATLEFMQPRQTVIDVFSTFLQCSGDRCSGWVSDPKLKRSMQHQLAQYPEYETENFWALYWHKRWQLQSDALGSLALQHLSAYLQEVCYWSAKTIQPHVARTSIADLFQTGIAQVHKVLNGFNPQYSTTLKSFSEHAFALIIKNTLRQQQEIDFCTDWALLHNISRKRLIKSLQQRGFNRQMSEQYLLAWECFRECYTPSNTKTRRMTRPDSETWQTIVKLYNTERTSQLSSATSASSAAQLEVWLVTCAKAIRAFLYPPIVSSDVPISPDETVHFLDLLPADMEDSLLSAMIAQEDVTQRQVQRSHLTHTLTAAIVQLDEEAQRLLQAYYGQELTQTQLSELLKVGQCTVSRHLNRVRRSLLLALAQWSQETLQTSPTPDALNSMNALLEEWLQAHYHPTPRV